MRKLLAIIEAPGKAAALKQTLRGLGLETEVVATAGHFASWPKSLWPMGARVIEAAGAPYVDEFARILSGERAAAVQAAIAKAIRQNASIAIATDPDPEGEAIALDILMLAATKNIRPDRLKRMRLTGLDETSVSLALAAARPMSWRNAAAGAAPARARALLDRLAGSACSKPGAPAGRVLTAGLALLKDGARNAPAGEIRIAATAVDGGAPFLSRIEIFHGADSLAEARDGIASQTIAALVKHQRFPRGIVPGRVRALAPLSAGAAIRIAGSPCYDACALVVDAGRAGLPARRTAAAAQSLYMKGLISYPRTAATNVPEPAALSLTRLAAALGVDAFNPESPLFSAVNQEDGKIDDPGGCHHGLHPLFGATRDRHETAALVDVIMSPGRDSSVLPDEDERLVYTLIARRAIQAGLPSRLERGVWSRDADDALEEVAEALEDVDWFREIAPRPPWECAPQIGSSVWPLEARVADALIRAKLARPSTVASHATRIAGYARLDDQGAGLPVIQINEAGAHMLDAAPAALRSGGFARAIDQLAKDAASWPGLAGEISAKGDSLDATKDAIGHMLAWALKHGAEEFQRQGGEPNLLLAPLSPIAPNPGEPVSEAFNNAPKVLAALQDDWSAGSAAPEASGEDVRFAAAAGRTTADEDEQKPVAAEIVREAEKIAIEDIDEEEAIIDTVKRPAIS